MLYEVPPLADRPASPRLHEVRTMLGVLEMVKLGITAAHDDAFFVPAPDPAAIGAVVQGCVDGGGRRWRWTSPT